MALFGLVALAASVAVWGITNLGASDPGTSAVPTESPEKIAEIRDILFADEAVKGILAGRHEGRDYWIRTYTIFEHADVENTGEPPIAVSQMYFEPPVTWEGEVPDRSDPCDGHYDDDGWLLDKQDSCQNEPYQVTMRHEQFIQRNSVHVFMDLRRGEVVEILGGGAEPDEIRDAMKGYATPGTPEQDAKVKEILFRHEAVEGMTAGVEEGTNFWIGAVGYVYAPGEPLTSEERTIAMVDVFFDPPLRWSGSLPTQLDLCERERETEGRYPDLNDACWSAPPAYELRPRGFANAPGIYADIDLRSGQVLQIGGLAPKPGDLENAKGRYAR